MGWLEDQIHTFRYTCTDGHASFYDMKAEEQDYVSERTCTTCGKPADYCGFEPREINVIGKVAYDQNGRMAYRISDGKGSVSHISQTKYNYMKTGVVEPQYTREYHEKLVKDGEKSSHLLTTDHNRRMASIKKAIDSLKNEEEGGITG